MLQPGDTVGGRYTIVEEINHGGMAHVFLALDPHLALDPDHPRRVAIKVINEDLAEEHEFQLRFRREAAVMAALPHDNIITIFDYDQQGKFAYIVYPYIEGGTLQSKLGAPLPPAEAVALLAPVAGALDFAHEQDPPIVHRDIKPSNILLTKAGKPIVADFGLAYLAGVTSSITITNAAVGRGTPPYMAPEQVTPDYPVSGRSDQYALGIVAYQLLTGTLPFVSDNPMSTAWMHVSHPLPPPQERNPAIADGVAAALTRALEKRPDRRFPTCAAFIEAIAAGAGLLTARDDRALREDEERRRREQEQRLQDELDRTVPAPLSDEIEKERREQERREQERREQERRLHSSSLPQAGRRRTAIFGIGIAAVFGAGVVAALFSAHCFGATHTTNNSHGNVASATVPPSASASARPSASASARPSASASAAPSAPPAPPLAVPVPVSDRSNGLDTPLGLAFDTSDTLWVADAGNHMIQAVNLSTGTLGPNIGTGADKVIDGSRTVAAFEFPRQIVPLTNGTLYVTDGSTVRQILTDRSVQTLAGNPNSSGSTNGVGRSALFTFPDGVGIDSHGDIFVAEGESSDGSGNDDVREILPDHSTLTFAGVHNPWGLDVDPNSDTVYVAESGANDVIAIDTRGNERVYAGTGHAGHTDDTRLRATFTEPTALLVATNGAVYVADGDGLSIRRISPNGTVTTIAHATTNIGSQTPLIDGMALDSKGNLYISDANNSRIYRIALPQTLPP